MADLTHPPAQYFHHLKEDAIVNIPGFVVQFSSLRRRSTSESVRRDHTGMHSFLNMSLMEARRRNASAFRLRFSQSLASRLQRPSHANVRSTTHRLGKTTKPLA